MAKLKCFILFPVIDDNCSLSGSGNTFKYADDENELKKFIKQIDNLIRIIQNNKETGLLYDPDKVAQHKPFIPVLKDFNDTGTIPFIYCLDYVNDCNTFQQWLQLNYIPRIFEANPKHSAANKSKRSNKGAPVTLMEYSDQEAQALLNSAISNPGESNKLYNYDPKQENYIVFQLHDSIRNAYHGYQETNDNNIPWHLRCALQKKHSS